MVMSHVLWFVVITYASFAYGDSEEFVEKTEIVKNNSDIIFEDDDLECEPSTETPSCNGDPNAISNDCGDNNCGRLCSNYDKGIACIELCRPGCHCKPKYVFDENIQKCVLPSQCTPVCKKDEVYNGCTNTGCVPLNCTELGFPIQCKRIDPRYCIKGCVCAGDKLRAKNGTCVPRQQCDSPCGGDKNSVPGCGNHCGRLCSNRNNNVTIVCTLECKLNGCDCKKGYLYDDAKGKCVLPKKCSVTCGKHEIYSPCVFPNCNFEKCSDKGKEYNCPLQNTSTCIGKCVCLPGYLRDKNNICIPEKSCPSSCNGDPNAVYNSCGNNNCGRTCSDRKKGIVCPAVCRPGCNCKPNYVYDGNTKKCVLPNQCTKICKKDEVYSSCTNTGCLPQNCTELGFPTPCKRIDPKYCVKGCICANDKLRHKNGTCVSRDQCESPCGGDENSVPGCGNNCGRLCSNRNNNVTIVCTLECKLNGCDCKEGYLYDDAKGKCVLPKKCSVTCGKHEIYSPCVFPNCNFEKCSDKGKEYNCPLQNTSTCIGKCVCLPGYLRDKNNICIPEKSCHSSCNGDPNAVYNSCGNNNCGRTCSDRKKGIVCPAVCRPGCNCKPNYVYDGNTKKCVLPNQCTKICKKDEVYSSCTNTGCLPQNCTELGFPTPCKRIDPKYCVKGCICANDKLRHKNGTCVSRDQCESPCGGDENSVPGCGNNCGRLCSNRNNNVTIVCTLECKLNGCDCKEGYLYDDAKGKCVLPKKCSVTCGKHEIYSPCVFPNCNFEKCSDKGKEYNCPLQNTSTCIGKCVCLPGYLRDKNNICIPEKSCHSSCNGDPNAVYNSCGNNNCGRTCSDRKKGIVCPAVCRPGCNCKPNYVYDGNTKKCVLPNQCTKICKKDEVYSSCTNTGCLPQNCTELGFPTPCKRIDPKYCVKGCICANDKLRHKNGTCVSRDQCESPCGGDENSVPGCGNNCGRLCSNRNNNVTIVCTLECKLNGCDCKEGYLYDDAKGKCVLPKKCSVTCGKHEIYSPCVFPNCNFEKCSDKGKEYNCPLQNTSTCIGKCVCLPGYLRENGVCIPEDTCPSQVCKSDEVYNSCVNNGCVPENCTQLGFPLSCAKVAEGFCIGGCLCQENNLRDKNGKCVPKTECDSPCGGDPNAISGCGVNCGRYCSDLNNEYTVACKKICNLNGCDCKEGYWYDDVKGKCVPPEQCPSPCGKHEISSTCVNSQCAPEYCTDLGKSFSCVTPAECYKGCICKPGYLRDRNGICIKAKYCPTSCNGDINAVPGCGVNCGRQCYNYNSTEPVSCITVCYDDGCDCKKGYVFDAIINKCVLPENCTPEIICDVNNNEVYSNCVEDGCSIRNCHELGTSKSSNHTALIQCTRGCVCKDGYLRASNGRCVPSNTCNGPCKGDENAVPGCGVNCGMSCSTYKIKELILCLQVCYEDGCDCKPGYVLDEQISKCVLPEQCSIPHCKPNEVYNNCTNTGCEPRSCDDLGNALNCQLFDEDSKCVGGCVCQPGYLYNKKGVCVPREECDFCGFCDGFVYCTDLVAQLFCNDSIWVYYYTDTIRACGGDSNATPGCGGYCGQLCSNFNSSDPIVCPLICNNINGCDCRTGFYLNELIGKCVAPEECPPPCGKNEVLSKCIETECKAEYCNQKDTVIPSCIDAISDNCTSGCICRVGYLRNRTGGCIPEKECPTSCKGDPNALPGCGVNCGKRCSGNLICPKICYPDGCDCKSGYLFDEILKKCVKPQQCRLKCGDNEVLSDCVNGGCDKRNCTQYNSPAICVDPIACIKGCVCKPGLLRNKAGKCVPQDQCPESQCKRQNEIYDYCAPLNDPQTCESIGKPHLEQSNEASTCVGKCRCKRSFYRNKIGECISKNDCLRCTGPHEYYSCGGACDNVCATLKNQSQKNCPIINIKCNEMCYCEEDYARNDKNICIPIKKCPENSTPPPPPVCGVNEEYNPCVIGLCRAQNCTQKGNSIPCPDVIPGSCKGGCVCKENYLKLVNGTCVPENECDVCPNGGYYSTCPPEPCDAEYCPKSRNDPLACVSNRKCSKPRCICGFNSHRSRSSGKCIATADCPPFPCKGEHEMYDPCPVVCPGQNCTDYINNSTCPKFGRIGIVVPCQPKCRCKKGYYRNNAGDCILGKKCLKDCKENEEYSECTNGGCDARNCTQLDKPVPCVKLDPKDCIKGCVCKKGYLRNSNGLCVPTDKCDKPLVCGKNEVITGCVNGGCYKRKCNQPILCVDPIPGGCIRGCKCKPDYVRDDNGKCIPESQCPSYKCGDDEVLSDCVNGGCDKRNCTQYNSPAICVDPIASACIKGCVCKPGLLRNKAGKCIPQDQCPESQCKRQNEINDYCAPLNDPQTCESIGKPRLEQSDEASTCVGKCRCKSGFYRNKIGECISEADCLKCTGPHEYYSCGGACDNVCATLKNQSQKNCPIINIKCNEMCYCEEDYARNDKNICIPIKKCSVCRKDEEYSTCSSAACDAEFCPQSRNDPVACVSTKECKPPRCVCPYNYRRDRNTTICIHITDCPPFECSGKNEHYVACPLPCPGDSCDRKNTPCPLYKNLQCKPECRCKHKYCRNKDGVCQEIKEID